VNVRYEYITSAFRLNRADTAGAPLERGGYQWTEYTVRGTSDLSRPIALNFNATVGGLWSGRQVTVNPTVTLKPSFRFRLSVGMQHSTITLDRPRQSFDATVWTSRANYSFTTNMFLDALAQYDAATRLFNSNVRFNVIHHPLSDLFIVYNERRFTTPDAPEAGRSLVVKFTQMVAF